MDWILVAVFQNKSSTFRVFRINNVFIYFLSMYILDKNSMQFKKTKGWLTTFFRNWKKVTNNILYLFLKFSWNAVLITYHKYDVFSRKCNFFHYCWVTLPIRFDYLFKQHDLKSSTKVLTLCFILSTTVDINAIFFISNLFHL